MFVLFTSVFPYTAQYGELLILLFMCISILFLSLIYNLFDEQPRPVHLLFCVYMIFYYLLPGYFHTGRGHFPFYDAAFAPEKIVNAAIVIIVFLICAGIGYSFDFPYRGGAPRITVPARLSQAILACAVAAVVAGAMAGFGALLQPRGEDVYADSLPSPNALMLSTIARSCGFYAFMLSTLAVKLQKTLISLIASVMACAIFLLVNSPLAIPRFVLGSYIISMFCVFLPVTRVQKLSIVLALVLSQGSLFAYVSYIARGDPETAFELSPFEYYVTSGDFDGLQSTINVVAMHDGKGGKEGLNLLSAILFFVPRSVWPEKSQGTGPEAGVYEGYPFNNLSSPLPSEFYVDFGIGGVAVLSLLFGLFMKLCDDFFKHFKKTKDFTGQLLVATFAGYIFIILRGSLVATLGPIVLSTAIAMICHKYTTVSVSTNRDPVRLTFGGEGEIGCLANPPSHHGY